jgi:16S rRNA (uracil1498-N3)-methyltransferase
VLPRFHVPDLSPGDDVVSLSAEETHHLVGVLRLTAGAKVHVFDGRGREWLARVEVVERGIARLSVVEEVTPAAAEQAVGITLAQAVLKRDRMDAVVRDATMLGVARITPLLTSHTSVPLRPADAPRAIERWQRLAVASCKQCGRARLPDIQGPVDIATLLRGPLPAIRLMLVEPRGPASAIVSVDGLREEARRAGAIVLVGPEGGWRAEELRLLEDAGFRAWSLGAITLRADAIPLAALSVLYYAWR